MKHLNIRLMRSNLSDTVNRAYYQGERIILERRGKPVAALVPVDDLRALEALENRVDLEEAIKALADMKRKGIKPIPWAEAERQLDRARARHGRTQRKAG
jgi:prevent-host-death family protein